MQKSLTPREEQVLELADSGRSNKAIAGSLGISTSAVATLLARARKKTCDGPCAAEHPVPHDEAASSSEIIDDANGTQAPPLLTEARGLTSAERAVVELALSGLSNAAIAEKRCCAERTVGNQLASAYAKLGIASRRELRAIATEPKRGHGGNRTRV
ncbi:MAG TPA: helix-turn-helix transcriptional regulator [Polyangiaceae bacterium]